MTTSARHSGPGWPVTPEDGNRTKGRPSTVRPAPEVSVVTLDQHLLQSLQPNKAFGDPTVTKGHHVNSMAFDHSGDRLITSGDDEKIQLFSMGSGRLSATHYSKKYGVDLVRFTHDPTTMLHASTKVDHAIRFHSLEKNEYLTYFRGHTTRVSSLDVPAAVAPHTFASASIDESVRLWDLRSMATQAQLVVQGHPIVRFDPTATILALAFNESDHVLLYDARHLSQHPFASFMVPGLFDRSEGHASVSVITSLHFNPSGTMLLVGTSGSIHYVLLAFTGALLYRLEGRTPLQATVSAAHEDASQQRAMLSQAGVSGNECGWTPDGDGIFSGAGQNEVVFWSIPASASAADRTEPGERMEQTLQPTLRRTCPQLTAIRAVAFNPKNAIMAMAGDQVVLWLPKEDVEEEEDDPKQKA